MRKWTRTTGMLIMAVVFVVSGAVFHSRAGEGAPLGDAIFGICVLLAVLCVWCSYHMNEIYVRRGGRDRRKDG